MAACRRRSTGPTLMSSQPPACAPKSSCCCSCCRCCCCSPPPGSALGASPSACPACPPSSTSSHSYAALGPCRGRAWNAASLSRSEMACEPICRRGSRRAGSAIRQQGEAAGPEHQPPHACAHAAHAARAPHLQCRGQAAHGLQVFLEPPGPPAPVGAAPLHASPPTTPPLGAAALALEYELPPALCRNALGLRGRAYVCVRAWASASTHTHVRILKAVGCAPRQPTGAPPSRTCHHPGAPAPTRAPPARPPRPPRPRSRACTTPAAGGRGAAHACAAAPAVTCRSHQRRGAPVCARCCTAQAEQASTSSARALL